MNPRDILNDVNDVGSSGLCLDVLPKDVLCYMRGYTGPDVCMVVINSEYAVGNHLSRTIKISGAWINKSEEYVRASARRKDILVYNSGVQSGKLIYIDGSPHVALPMLKSRIYGVKKRKRKRKSVLIKKSVRCKGRTKSNKRCKHRVNNDIGLCSVHKE